ncbi:MAG: hypothetical protein IID44_09760 [Planctomycetes bacterium]|nr:hypothetical protein [Planctomycetota bacterium]
MKLSLTQAVVTAAMLCSAVFSLALPTARAAEPATDFLNELRAHRYYDMAMLYLAEARTNPRIDDAWKETITYEEGVTLLESAMAIGNRDLRVQQLNEGQDKIKKFVAEHPNHPKAIGANGKLADALARRGMGLVFDAKQSSAAGRKAAMLKEARGFYDEAQEKLAETLKALFAILNDKKEFPPGLLPGAKFDRRKALRSQVVEAKFNSAKVAYLMAATAEEPGGEEHKQLLIAAAVKYQKLGEVFRVRGLWGLYARQREGVCYLEAEKHKEALTAFNHVMLQGDEPPPLFTMKIQTMPHVLKSFIALKEFDSDRVKETLVNAAKYLKSFRGRAAGDKDALELRYHLALLHQAMANEAKENKDGRNNKEVVKLAREGLKFPSARRKDFKKLLENLGRVVKVDLIDEGPPTFASLLEQAGQARHKWQAAVQTAAAAKENKPNLLQKADDAKTKTLGLYQLALRAIEPGTDTIPPTTISQITYAQTAMAYVHLVSGEYYETAVLGEFVARNFPGSHSAARAAGYALLAYKQLYREAVVAEAAELAKAGTPKTFEAGHVVDLALFIVEEFPKSSEFSKAFEALILYSIRLEELDKAAGFLEKVETNNPARAAGEMRVGQAYWYKYRRLNAQVEEDRPSPAVLGPLLAKAKKLLLDGIKHVDKVGSVDRNTASAALSLARIYLDTTDSDESIKWLEDKRFGALTLIAAKHEVSKDLSFVRRAYGLALRAYVTATTPQLDKANEILDRLEKLTEGDADGAKKLTASLISIASDLEKMIYDLPADKQEKKAQIIKGFEVFLQRIEARGGGNLSLSVSRWMAGTWFKLAEGGQGKRKEPDADDRRRYDKSIELYKNILSKSKEFKLAEAIALSINIRLAICYKKIGEFEDATDLLTKLLRKKLYLRLQIEAARVYQEQAERRGDADFFKRAIGGGEKDPQTGKKTIWGWQTLSKKMAPLREKKASYHKAFHTAQYNAATCWFQYGLQAENDVKDKSLGYAILVLDNTRIHDPEMGGKQWKAKYDRLRKEIEAER